MGELDIFLILLIDYCNDGKYHLRINILLKKSAVINLRFNEVHCVILIINCIIQIIFDNNIINQFSNHPYSRRFDKIESNELRRKS